MESNITVLIERLEQRYDADNDGGPITWADTQLLSIIVEQWQEIRKLEKRLEKLEDQAKL